MALEPPASRAKRRPGWSLYDNIWDIRLGGYPSQEEVERALTERPRRSSSMRLGRGILCSGARGFIYNVARLKRVEPAAWKIVIPRLDRRDVGAIYYAVEAGPKSLICRATYGYWGRGPHEAALIEACLELLGLHFEVRDGDHLLNLFLKQGRR
jgi:hypothetical protein